MNKYSRAERLRVLTTWTKEMLANEVINLQDDIEMWRLGICPADVAITRPGYDGPEVTCATCPDRDGCRFKRKR